MHSESIDLALSWLPPGYVETERWTSPGGGLIDGTPASRKVARVFGKGRAFIMIIDGADRDGTWTHGDPVTLDGRRGVVTASKDGVAAELQVPWRSGRLLQVTTQQMPEARAIATRIANSIRSAPAVSVDVPLSCSDPLCGAAGRIDVSGSAGKWTATVGGPTATAALTSGARTTPPKGARNVRHLTVNGHSATLWRAGMRSGTVLTLPLGDGRAIRIDSSARRPLQEQEAVRVAGSVRVLGGPDYSWLGTRPG
jgi:hypothetical protein